MDEAPTPQARPAAPTGAGRAEATSSRKGRGRDPVPPSASELQAEREQLVLMAPTLLIDTVVGVTRPHVTSGLKDQTTCWWVSRPGWAGQREKALGEQAEGLHTSCGPHRVYTALRLRLLRPSGSTPMETRGRG